MNKILVSSIAVLTTVAALADCPFSNGQCGAKPKKQRIIYITAAEPEMYGEPVFADTVISHNIEEEPEVTPAPVMVSEPVSTAPLGYVGLRLGVDMPSWRNKYKASPSSAALDPDSDHDSYIFEPVFGADIFAGRHFGPAWRGDLELGYISQFKDSEDDFTFKLSTTYLMANAYYDFLGGFYLGGGLGFALPKATLNWDYFTSKSESDTRLSFMWGLSTGLTHPLSDSIVLDIRYRISGFWGPKWSRMVKQPDYQNAGGTNIESLETRVGFVLDNSISLGVRYEF